MTLAGYRLLKGDARNIFFFVGMVQISMQITFSGHAVASCLDVHYGPCFYKFSKVWVPWPEQREVLVNLNSLTGLTTMWQMIVQC